MKMKMKTLAVTRRLAVTAALVCSCGDDETGPTVNPTTSLTVGSTTAASTTAGSTSASSASASSTSAGSTSAATTAGGGSTGSSSPVYPACSFDPQPTCDLPFDGCNVFGGGSAPHHCTFICETVRTCPDPETGTATVVCEPSDGPDDVCALDCAGSTCPDGMTCVATGAGGDVRRCAYNP